MNRVSYHTNRKSIYFTKVFVQWKNSSKIGVQISQRYESIRYWHFEVQQHLWDQDHVKPMEGLLTNSWVSTPHIPVS